MKQKQFQEGLSFDDVLLLPQFSEVRRSQIDLSAFLTPTIKLKIPLVSSPMDTVTEANLAIALAKEDGIGIIHRNMSISKQVAQVKKVKSKKLLVGAAVGIGRDLDERVKALVEAKIDCLVVDSAHGHASYIIEITRKIKGQYPKLQLVSGNVGTSLGFENLAKAGADAIRVGLGPGSICTTRIISGVGTPQLSAILECAKVAKKYYVKLIADGGIKYSGDITKALAAGADTVMIGSLFAKTKEAPGKIVKIKGKKFKYYRGMGSISAMKEGSAFRYGQRQNLPAKKLVAEGIEGLVPYKGTLSNFLFQLIGGLKSGMAYVGAKNLKELQKKAQFVKISPATFRESHPHGLIITDRGGNY